ncbi:MAG: methylmalonyl Co-A mutase-associated GTPase MeaB [Actinobacteria bacterium]|nr:methylmalonyl Co-A mutase-associated GTPase MeaB [Actinomycetota bacterium]MCB9390807.1 methylmalonyl Co-A mutase-associated GTPase MeaB [Acidimicrobiia bacterium]
MSPDQLVDELAAGIAAQQRRALARGITLVESSRVADRSRSDALVERLSTHEPRALRIGISGTPGVGKSTFIEAFGMDRIEQGQSLAVLAVDPSSQISGGSILGDKTRMERLARNDAAFIRPSPSGGNLGGVARRTREAITLCEAAGFDSIIIETVGVGQSEVAVEAMVDLFILLLAPGGGDDLQGIKRGVMELADIIVINKADGEMARQAQTTASDYAHALSLMRPKRSWWTPQVVTSSARDASIANVIEQVERFRVLGTDNGEIQRSRSEQAKEWFASELALGWHDLVRSDVELARSIAELERRVTSGERTPSSAAREVLQQLTSRQPT